MKDEINLGDLSDRELLLLTAQKVNKVDTRLDDHGRRIKMLERAAWSAAGAVAIVGMWVKAKFRIES